MLFDWNIHYNDILFAKEIKSIYPNNKIHFIGHIASQMNEWIKENCSFIDYVSKDRTEVYLYKLGNNIEDNRITINDFPTINYKLFPYEVYQEKLGKRIAYLLSSEGCKNGCSYCPYKMLHNHNFAYRDIDKVINDLKEISFLGIELVQFRDPFFTYDTQRVMDICNRIISEKIKIRWYCETCLSSINSNLVKLMKDAGCELIMFGIEAAKVDNLKKMGRKTSEYEEYKEKISFIKEVGIDTMAFYIIGMNNETWEDIQNTYYYSEKLNTTFVQYSVFIDYQETIAEMKSSNYKYYRPLSNSMSKSKCEISQNDLVALSNLFEFTYYLKRFGLKKNFEMLKYNTIKFKQNRKKGELVLNEIENI